jgi:hypothetical protein
MLRHLIRLCTVLLLALPAWALADEYRVELVVFEQSGASGSEVLRVDESTLPARETVGDLPLRAADPSSLQLGPIAYTLDRRGYPVLLHTAWVEKVGGRQNDNWYRVATGRLEGVVRVRRGRFLHFDTDLLLRTGESRPIHAASSRRMRSTELHYIDHPRLGIIVRIDPYTSPEAKPAP